MVQLSILIGLQPKKALTPSNAFRKEEDWLRTEKAGKGKWFLYFMRGVITWECQNH